MNKKKKTEVIPECIFDDDEHMGYHEWGKLEKEYYDCWMLDDNMVKFYYQKCKHCGFIRIIG